MNVLFRNINKKNPSADANIKRKKNQYAHATTRRATAKHQKKERARRANIQNHHIIMANTPCKLDNQQKSSMS